MAKSTKDASLREDGTKKGLGWKGPIKTKTKDAEGRTWTGVMTEVSIGHPDSTGSKRLVPSIVSSSTKKDLKVLARVSSGEMEIPDTLVTKAYRHADSLAAKGQSPWAPVGYKPKKKGK